MTFEKLLSLHKISSIEDCDTFYLVNGLIEISKTNKNFMVLVNELKDLNMVIPINRDRMLQKEMEKAVKDFMDTQARIKGYDDILSACSYAIARGRFQQEGIKFAEWRTDVWDYCYTELDKIENGLRSRPTVEEFIAELPALQLN